MGLFVTETDAREILEAVINKLQSDVGETLYPGDERRSFGESMAALIVIAFNTMDEAAKNSLLKYAIGECLDAIGDSYECNRLEAEKAYTTLRYSLGEEYGSDITVPAGTRAATGDGYYFATDEDLVIPAGDTYADVSAHAIEGGTNYNGLLSGTITTMVDLVSYVDAVTNTVATQGGTDKETDDDYRERIRLRLSSYSTAGTYNSYKYWALSADNDVADAYIVSPSANVIYVYIVTTSGTIPSASLIAEVQAVVNADDVRPLNDQVTTKAPTTSNYDIELEYYVSSENEDAVVAAIEGEDGVLEQYRLWQDTVIARDINPDKLKRMILDAGADRVDITYPEHTTLTGAIVAHFSGTSTVTHEVYDDV